MNKEHLELNQSILKSLVQVYKNMSQKVEGSKTKETDKYKLDPEVICQELMDSYVLDSNKTEEPLVALIGARDLFSDGSLDCQPDWVEKYLQGRLAKERKPVPYTGSNASMLETWVE